MAGHEARNLAARGYSARSGNPPVAAGREVTARYIRDRGLALRPYVAEVHRNALAHELREEARVPVRQPHAAVRARVPDRGRLTGPVDPVVLLRQGDPDDPDRAVRTRREALVLLRVGNFVEKRGLPVEPRVEGD